MSLSSEVSPRTVSLPDHESPSGYGEEVIGLRNRETGVEYALDPEMISQNIGSAAGCDVRIQPDPYVSALHAVVVRKDGELHLIGKGKNGTFLNGARIDRGFLRDGAHLQIGKTTLIAFSLASRYRLTPHEYLRGSDEVFRRAVSTALALAPTKSHALILGETGTGKRTLAALIHQESPRASAPCRVVDCDALPSARIEGGLLDAIGRARGGTLLIHGLEHLPPDFHGYVRRVVSDHDGADTRVLMTACDPEVETLAGYQWFRDCATVLKLPALRERWEDVPVLVRMFVDEFRAIAGPKRIASKTVAALCGYDWPGNVEQLREAVRRSMALSEGDELTFELFWPDRGTLARLLRQAVSTAWHGHGSFGKAANALGIPKTTLIRLVEQLDVRK